MKERTLPEVAKALSLSSDTLRYWVKLSGVTVEKKGRSVFISDEGFSLLSRMAGLVSEGFPPAEAAKRATDTAVTVPVKLTEQPTVDLAPVSNRLEQIERAILCQIEQGNAILRENRLLREENSELRSELASIRKLLAPPPAQEQKATERSLADDLSSVVQEFRAFVSGITAPFVSLFRLG